MGITVMLLLYLVGEIGGELSQDEHVCIHEKLNVDGTRTFIASFMSVLVFDGIYRVVKQFFLRAGVIIL